MNQSEIEVGRVLLHFEQVVEEYHNVLDELENYLILPEVESEKLDRLLRRLRRNRRQLLNGIQTIVDNINGLNDSKMKEEALGLLNYFYIVGLNDDENVLKKAKEIAQGLSEEIDKDLEIVSKIRSLILKFVY
ncbi:hypothetical protein [Stygiolobus caldivivus]|uniref:Uncharacterized protein n=1 Tax=Stygiolobus caldivivus TaxID=2824673 RepID=A0A8D5U7N5_9CREN|nr:hypothetical protein [Stygiolobus caldivivus]BCU70722.1 hypothetical protein KN1_20190 [Stygiolobus caldivivus]